MPRLFKNLRHQLYSAQFLADAGNSVVIFIKYRHDHDFIDHIPHVNQSLEFHDLPPDPCQLLLQNFPIGKL